MSNKIFEERLKRISSNGPSGETIPGQVGEFTPAQSREMTRIRKRKPKSRASRKHGTLTSLLFGGILGAIVGLVFQEVVGVEVFLNFDWEAELAIAQKDLVRGAVWGALATGLAALILTLPNRRRWRRIASWATAYTFTAVGVNAQDLMDLVPPETLAQFSGG